MREFREYHILLIEDNPGDVRLTQEALKEGGYTHHMSVVHDGEAALQFLAKQGAYESATRPDIILLDLNIPRKSGLEVLKTIKANPTTRSIPVIVLTTSEADQDIQTCYASYANCYVSKPVDINRFIEVMKGIENFWFDIVTLPTNG